MDIDLTGSRVINYRAISNPSHHEWMGTTQVYTDPDKQPTASVSGRVSAYRADGDQSFDVTVSYSGKNYAFPGADWERTTEVGGYEVSISPKHGLRRTVPDLDVTNRLSGHIDRSDRWLHVVCDLRGDGFPNSETFAVDASGIPLALCTHIRVGVAAVQLFGNRRIPMAYSMIEAQVDGSDAFEDTVKCEASLDFAGDGSPVDVGAAIRRVATPRTVWNRVHASRDALGPEARRNMDNSIWSGLRERFGW